MQKGRGQRPSRAENRILAVKRLGEEVRFEEGFLFQMGKS